MKYFAYIEPCNSLSHPRLCIITEEAAIQQSKDFAKANGYEYDNEEDALQDFVIVHWAWEINHNDDWRDWVE